MTVEPFAPLATFELDVPLEWWLNANDRVHYQQKARGSRWIRDLAAVQARRQGVPKDLPVPVRVVAYVTTPSRRREDPNNSAPTTKAIIDGLTDYGCWVDDDHTRVVGPDHRYGGVTPHRRTVRLVIYPTEIDGEHVDVPGTGRYRRRSRTGKGV